MAETSWDTLLRLAAAHEGIPPRKVKMTFDELMKNILEMFPNAIVQEEDGYGEILIFTGKRENLDGLIEDVPETFDI